MLSRFFTGSFRPFLLALLLLLSLAGSLLTPLLASAYTPETQNDDYQTVDTLKMSIDGSYGITCPAVDISTNWSQYITDEALWPQYQDGFPKMKQTFLQAQETGSWGVTQAIQEMGNSTQRGIIENVIIYWDDVDQMPITYPSGTGEVHIRSKYSVALQIQQFAYGWGGCTIIAHGFYDGQTQGYRMLQISSDAAIPTTADRNAYAYRNFFVSNATVTYPSGYTGTPIKNTAGNPGGTTYYPDVDYVVDNRTVTMTYKENVPVDGCYNLNWTLYANEDQENHLDQKLGADPKDVYRYEVTDQGKYVFLVDLVIPTPCAPLPEGVNVETLVLTLDMDGSAFSGSTQDLDCADQGEYTGCTPPSPLEDCSTYGADFGAAVGCHLRNFFTGMAATLRSWFVPTTGVWRDIFDEFTDFFSEKLGFLYQSVATVLGFFNAIITAAVSPSPILSPPGTYFGAPVSIDFSAAKDVVGQTAWDMILLAIRATTSVAILFGLYRTYLAMISEGKD